MSRTLSRPLVFDFSIAGALAGGVLVVIGFISGVLPLIKGRYEACIYHLSPPTGFLEQYQEGITSPGAHVSIFPFGAQCPYVANSTGETALSALSPWPTTSIIAGVVAVVVGSVTAAVVWHRTR